MRKTLQFTHPYIAQICIQLGVIILLMYECRQIFYTDIHTAVWKNDLNLVKMFLESDPKRLSNLPDMSDFGEEMTPLHYAAYQGEVEQKASHSSFEKKQLTYFDCTRKFGDCSGAAYSRLKRQR